VPERRSWRLRLHRHRTGTIAAKQQNTAQSAVKNRSQYDNGIPVYYLTYTPDQTKWSTFQLQSSNGDMVYSSNYKILPPSIPGYALGLTDTQTPGSASIAFVANNNTNDTTVKFIPINEAQTSIDNGASVLLSIGEFYAYLGLTFVEATTSKARATRFSLNQVNVSGSPTTAVGKSTSGSEMFLWFLLIITIIIFFYVYWTSTK
jgi:hypothetical protein